MASNNETMSTNNNTSEVSLTEEEIKKIKVCPLHSQPYMNPGGIWYAPNSFGYSTYSPGCNGCVHGERDIAAGLWMSGFGVESLKTDSSSSK